MTKNWMFLLRESAAWWLTLSLGVGWMRDRLTPAHMAWINRISGAIITAFGAFALLTLLI